MTCCKKTKMISTEPDNTFFFFYNYAFLPMLIVYLCIPIVTLIKYIFTDIMKVYNAETKKDLTLYNDNDEMVNIKVENALLKGEIQHRKYVRDMLSVLKNYEYTLQRFVEEHKKVFNEKETLQQMLNVIEDDYQILSSKYAKAKEVIDGLEQNEKFLRKNLRDWESTMTEIEKRYESFKEYTVDKIDEENNHTKTTESEYKHEVSKVKSKLVESQIKINKTQTNISTMSMKKGVKKKNSNNIFDPLISDID